MSVDLTKGATVELVKTLSDDLRTRDDNTKYSSAGAAMRDKANVDGYYEGLTSGTTEQIASSIYEEDNTPYIFRTAGGSIDIGDREEDTIVGGTVAWNQQIYNGNFASDTGWGALTGCTKSIANNEAVLTLAANFAGIQNNASAYLPTDISGHKYLISADIKASVARTNSVGLGLSDTASHYPVRKIFSVGTSYATYAFVGTQTDGTVSGRFMVYDTKGADGLTLYVKNIQCFDLTQMFGSTIADYIYSLETANAGAGVAWFKKLFNKPYYAYDAGSLKSVEGLSAHKMTGFNQCSSYTSTTSTEVYTHALYAEADLLPNTTYAITFKGAVGNYIYRNENIFANAYSTTCTGEWQTALLTTRADIEKESASKYLSGYGWIIFKNATGNTVTPNFKDVCINISWDGERDGEYEPYEEHVYDLDSSLTLRGIPKLDENNNLYYDGDVYNSDGTVERKYGIVDLSTLYFYKSSSGLFMTTSLANVIKKSENTAVATGNVLSSMFTEIGASPIHGPGSESPSPDKVMALNINGIMYFNYLSTTDVEVFKTAMSGVYLVYELETPTTETAQPYSQNQYVNDFGTEEYVSETNMIPVGHETKYQANLKAKLEMAPDSPSDNGDYIVRHTNGQNQYVPLVIPTELPTMPTDTNGSYKLVCTVTNGVATMSWETDE